jgi:hypothetical protein
MLNIQVLNDIDGYQVEIDRRQLHAAHVERHGDGQVIVIEHGEDAITRLGIGARCLVEDWLGRTLDVRLSDAEVWAHSDAERIYRSILREVHAAPNTKMNRIARAMTREQWTEGVRQVLEARQFHLCEACKAKPLQ